MSTGTDLGFNFDPETIELLDAILLNITTDDELHEEFIKLKFIKTLQDQYDGSKGPIRQMMDKMAKIEQEHTALLNDHVRVQTDCRRAVADMTTAAKAIRAASAAPTDDARFQALKKLEGIEHRQNSYTWNQK